MVHCEGFLDGMAEMEGALDAGEGGPAHGVAEGGVGGEILDGSGKLRGVAGIDDESGFAVEDEFGHAADAGDDGGPAEGHGFEDGLGQAFALDGGHDDEVASAGEGGGVRAEAGKVDAGRFLGGAEGGLFADFTDDEEVEVEGGWEQGHGPEEVVDAFDFSDIAGEDGDGGVGRDAELVEDGTGGGGVPGGIVAFPDDVEAGVGEAEGFEVVADGVGDAGDGVDAGVEVGKPGGGVKATEVAHGAAVGEDFGRVGDAAGGAEGEGEGAVGEGVDEVDVLVAQDGEEGVAGLAVDAATVGLGGEGDLMAGTVGGGEAAFGSDDVEVNPGESEGAGEFEFDAVVAKSGDDDVGGGQLHGDFPLRVLRRMRRITEIMQEVRTMNSWKGE